MRDETNARIIWVNEDKGTIRINVGWTEYTRTATPAELQAALGKRVESYAL